VVAVGILISVGIYFFSRQARAHEIEAEFSRRAESRHALTTQIVASYEAGLYSLKNLFEGSDNVSRDEFREVAADILARYPGTKALEWLPVVASADRAAVEAEITRDSGRPFQFVQSGPNGSLVRAADRAEHYPIIFIEPMVGNERAFGLDVQAAASQPFLERARSTRQFVVSAQFTLIQGQKGVAMIWPVFRRAPGELTERICRGFVQAIVLGEEILQQSQLRSPAEGIEEYYADTTNGWDSATLLHAHRPEMPAASATLTAADTRTGIFREYVIELGGRKWSVVYRPTAAWLAKQHSYLSELWLVVGFAITGLLAALIVSMARRTAAIQRLVAARTAELSESRRQLSTLLHALPGAAYRCTCNTHFDEVVFISEGILPLTGYTAEEFMTGRIGLRDLMPPDDAARVHKLICDAMANHRGFESEYRIRTRSGADKWVLSRGRGVYPSDGQTPFYEGLAIDITDRKQAEAEKMTMERRLLESQKLESLGLLAGGIAHDFNNILTGIMGYASLARHSELTRAELTDHLLKIESSGARAAELCQQMLAFSGRGQFVVESVDLSRTVRDTLPLLQGSLPSRARLELALSAEPVTALGDVTQIRQIVMNLILNAGEALPPDGGSVVVSTGSRWMDQTQLSTARVGSDLPAGRYVFIEVRDTGCGMDSQTLARIFDPFFTTKFTGRGLGLAAVLGIVRGHFGGLQVESEPGHGSTFTLLLPASTDVAASAAPGGSANPWKRTGRVLLVDDEPPVRDIAAQLIRSFGLEVTTAGNGAEGVELFRANPTEFDLIVLDQSMPGMDGIETLAALRAIAPTVRVILVSGYNESDRVAQLAKDTPLLFLQKPFSRSKLGRHLRSLLG
jgi:PAS domain S-box-containing protein